MATVKRSRGSLGELKTALWAVVRYNLGVLEDPSQSHETRRAAGNSLTQAGTAYAKVMMIYKVAQDVKRLEELAPEYRPSLPWTSDN
jgi:hypothetical protein